MVESWVFGKRGKWGWVLCFGGGVVVAWRSGSGYGVGNDSVCGL
jgi:hypothetical protein